jgi:hypothetical protein
MPIPAFFARELARGASLYLAGGLILGLAAVASSANAPARDANRENAGTVEIANPEQFDAIYAISDAHGMFAEATALLAAAGLTSQNGETWAGGRSLLVVVGDSIDKGPRSLDLIDLWLRLQAQAPAQGGRVLHLLGNHEAEFLADPQGDYKANAFVSELAARGLSVAGVSTMQTARGAFLLSQPLAAKVGKWLFAHAGLFAQSSWAQVAADAARILRAGEYGNPLLADGQSLLEAREWLRSSAGIDDAIARLDSAGLAGCVFGHQPKAFGAVGQIASARNGRLIKIDTGMAPDAGSHSGQILKIANPAELARPSGSPRFQVVDPTGSVRELSHSP